MCKNDILFSKIGCKGTLFYAHSQIKCTKTAKMCTLWLFCAMIMSSYYLIRLPRMSRVNSFVIVRVAALVAFFATRPVVDVFDFVFLPVTLSLT